MIEVKWKMLEKSGICDQDGVEEKLYRYRDFR